jgi:hypothetical protein
VTIKHPPAELEGFTADNMPVGTVYNVAPHLAILMIAAGWVRTETRSRVRRQRDACARFDRRHAGDRRSATSTDY